MLDAKWTAALNEYFVRIKKDYTQCMSPETEVETRMIKEFNEGLRYEIGNKFIKVISVDGVHSFLALETISYKNGVSFNPGDILMPANWRSPAKNKPRGNIFGDYTIKWTGPYYLQ